MKAPIIEKSSSSQGQFVRPSKKERWWHKGKYKLLWMILISPLITMLGTYSINTILTGTSWEIILIKMFLLYTSNFAFALTGAFIFKEIKEKKIINITVFSGLKAFAVTSGISGILSLFAFGRDEMFTFDIENYDLVTHLDVVFVYVLVYIISMLISITMTAIYSNKMIIARTRGL